MQVFFKACTVLILVIWALLLPRFAAVLLHLHPDTSTAVICTGTKMVIIQLAPDGTPVEVAQSEDQPCTLMHAELLADNPVPNWVFLAAEFGPVFQTNVSKKPHHNAGLINRDSQAPPIPWFL